MKYYYSLEYTEGTSSRTRAAEECEKMLSQFMSGEVPEKIFNNFSKLVNRISGGQPENGEICFVPASSDAETASRFSSLASMLSESTGVHASLNGMSRRSNGDGRLFDTPEFVCDSQSISGRNIILVDSLVTRGRTINAAANALIDAGALSVTGLVAAKAMTGSQYAA